MSKNVKRNPQLMHITSHYCFNNIVVELGLLIETVVESGAIKTKFYLPN